MGSSSSRAVRSVVSAAAASPGRRGMGQPPGAVDIRPDRAAGPKLRERDTMDVIL
ncbi:hypothetical protein GCM10009738_70000 [Kitasatospora viridis]